MRLPILESRKLLSALLIIAVSTVFSLSSFAFQSLAATRDEVGKTATPPVLTPQIGLPGITAASGTLMCSGPASINGNLCRSGATVLSGSVVANHSAYIASVDMGRFGRLYLQPKSSVRIVFDNGAAKLEPTSPSVQFVVTSGALRVVDLSGTQTLGPGDSNSFKGTVAATMSGDSIVTVADDQSGQQPSTQPGANSPQNPPPSSKKAAGGPPWWAYLILVGVAGGIVGGIKAGSGGGASAAARLSEPTP